MGQLRDWWPSEDALLKRSSAVVLPNLAHAHPSPPLQLAEAAAALNDDVHHYPNVHSSRTSINDSSLPLSSFLFPPSTSPQARPRQQPIKLINSQDHKQELLRNLLNPPLITADLPQNVHSQDSPSLSLQEDNLLSSASLSFGGLLQEVRSKPHSSLSVHDDVSLGLYGTFTPQTLLTSETPASGTSETPASGKVHKYLPISESSTLEGTRSGRDGAFGVNKGSSLLEKSRIIHEVQHDSSNNETVRTHGSQEALQQSMKNTPSKPESIHSLHEVQHHPINKESLSRREIHIFSERQRRKGMSHLYATLLSLLPDAKPKTDRCKVLTDAMDYIHLLREQVDALGCHRSELLASLAEQQGDNHNVDTGSSAEVDATTTIGISDEVKNEVLSSSDVAVRFCGRDAFVTLNGPKKKGVWSGILQILHEHDMEILNVTLSTGNELDHHCIHARLLSSSSVGSQDVEKMLQDLILSYAILE